jgi:hypothetical protein
LAVDVWARKLRKMTREEIALKAYQVWQAAGCPGGQEEQNWKNARTILMRGDGNYLRPLKEFFKP